MGIVADGFTHEVFSKSEVVGQLPELIDAVLQQFLDEWLEKHPAASIDYIHGEAAVRQLTEGQKATGILLPAMDKYVLFDAVRKGGALPRKAFSMGEAVEKRYYLECRKIRAK